MTSAISPTPANPCSTYIRPQVISLNRYGLRGKNMVRPRDIMKTPVRITDKPHKIITPWKCLFSSGYLANFRGGGEGIRKNRRPLFPAASAPDRSGQIAQKSSQKEA